MNQLSGKVAIITGAARGQGEAEAALFVERGAKVVLTDLLEAGEQVASRLGDAAAFVRHDVADEGDWRTVVSTAVDRFGGVDILVNNAAIYAPGPLEETDPATLERFFRVNQLGPFLGMRAVREAMIARGGGSIVNISSVGGLRGYPGAFAYCASKWAVRGMSRCAAADYAKFGIRVNSLHPGVIDTPMLEANTPEDNEHYRTITPLGRLGLAVEVAEMVAFLASDAASYVTGAEIAVDGGTSA